jgi:hypothetical protein
LLIVRICGWRIICSSGIKIFIGIFSFSLQRPMHDWEVEVVSAFFELYSQRVRQGGEDKFVGFLLKGSHLK